MLPNCNSFCMHKENKKVTKMKSNYLPEEVVAEILYRLPIKSILRCTCVCKSCYTFIKSSKFISTHLQNTTLASNNNINNSYLLCTIADLFEFRILYRYTLRLDNGNFEKYMPLHSPVDIRDRFTVAGSCNGLICLYEFETKSYRFKNRVILWNPLIRKSLSLPVPTYSMKNDLPTDYKFFMGFGFDSRTHDYKVLSILIMTCGVRAELYSFNLNSWKDITDITPKYIIVSFGSAFVNGALHWIVNDMEYNDEERFIMVFDLSGEVFHEIWLPERIEEESADTPLRVLVYEESSIAVVHLSHETCYSNIWVMKEYGVKSSWVKLASVGNMWSEIFLTRVLGFRNNREALIELREDQLGSRRRRSLASHNLNSQQFNTLMDLPGTAWCHEAYSYVGSLVLLDK